MIDPSVQTAGNRIFRDDGALAPLLLVGGRVTTTAAMFATHVPEDDG